MLTQYPEYCLILGRQLQVKAGPSLRAMESAVPVVLRTNNFSVEVRQLAVRIDPGTEPCGAPRLPAVQEGRSDRHHLLNQNQYRPALRPLVTLTSAPLKVKGGMLVYNLLKYQEQSMLF